MGEPLALRGVRDLPHNLEAEQAVLGAVLLDETAFDQVAPILKSEDFYALAHQHVFSAFEELAKESRKIDPVLVQQIAAVPATTFCDAKTYAANAAPDNCKDVLGAVPSGLHVVKVSTLHEARQAVEAIGAGKGSTLPTCTAADVS